MNKTYPSQAEAIQNICSFFIAILLAIITGFLVYCFFHPHSPSIDEVRVLFLDASYVRPKPTERILFFSFLILLLPSVFVSIQSVRHISYTYTKNIALHYIGWLAIFLITTGAIIPFLGSDFFALLIPSKVAHHLFRVSSILIMTLSIPLCISLFSRKKNIKPLFLQKFSPVFLFILYGVIFISVFPLQVQNISMVTDPWAWTSHFEAVFYTVSQVVTGKTLLIDLPAQYGLYAEVLKPFFILTGLSVFSFTMLMSLLEALGLCALLWVCLRLIRNNWLRFICMVSLCFLIGFSWEFNAENPYYQYWPIRFFFPALSVLVFIWAEKRGMRIRSVLLIGLLSGLALIWNLDSGVPVFGSFAAYLGLSAIFPIHGDRQRYFIRLLLLCSITILFFSAFLGYLQIKSGAAIAWNELLKYQKLFYMSGFAMLPIPRYMHPWIVIIGGYILGITGALYMRIKQKSSLAWHVIFYLSILGLGLFSYYEGRSHEVVFTMVIWPAVLIAFILADRTIRAVRVNYLPAYFLFSAAPIILFGLIATGLFMDAIPKFTYAAAKKWPIILKPTDTPVTGNITFIQDTVHSSKEAVILAPHQAVYFAETKLASAVTGPGLAETILVADRQNLLTSLLTKPVDHLFIQADQNGKVSQEYANLLERYVVKSTSKYGLLYLQPKNIVYDNFKTTYQSSNY